MKTTKYCAGCYDDFYNQTKYSGCWNLKNAKLVQRKEVHINDVPPWKHQRVIKVPGCYHKPKFVYVDPKRKY